MIRRILVGSAIGVGLLAASAAPAFAQSTTDLQSQIQALMTQITQLAQQLQQLRAQAAAQFPNHGEGQGQGGGDMHASSTPPVSGMGMMGNVCRIINRTLSQGTEGDDVHDLQEFLHEEGFLSASSTGFFGAMTQAALQKWQGAQGLDSVGIVGPQTRDRIRARCGTPPMASSTLPMLPLIPSPFSIRGSEGSGDQNRGNDGRPPHPVACTMDAMRCANGKWVGRSGSDCQFRCGDATTTDSRDSRDDR